MSHWYTSCLSSTNTFLFVVSSPFSRMFASCTHCRYQSSASSAFFKSTSFFFWVRPKDKPAEDSSLSLAASACLACGSENDWFKGGFQSLPYFCVHLGTWLTKLLEISTKNTKLPRGIVRRKNGFWENNRWLGLNTDYKYRSEDGR